MKTITFKFPSPEIEALAIHELSEHFGYPTQVAGEPVNIGTDGGGFVLPPPPDLRRR